MITIFSPYYNIVNVGMYRTSSVSSIVVKISDEMVRDMAPKANIAEQTSVMSGSKE